MSEKIKFQNKNELEKYVSGLLCKLDEKEEFNIYLHQISDWGDYLIDMDKIVDYRISSILENKLKISGYACLCGTAKLMGSTKEVSAKDILDYRYYKMDTIAVCLIAIPKYIEVDGKKLEFSSHNGHNSWNLSQELLDEYVKKFGHLPDRQHMKSSIFDVVKRYNELPKCYMLGVEIMDEKDNKFEFVESKTHLIDKNDEEKKLHDKALADEVTKLYEKYNTKDMTQIILEAYKEELPLREAESEFDL